MSNQKKLKRVVAHNKLYMAVGGKLQHIPQGTEITVTEEQCERMGKKLSDPSQKKSHDATEEGGKRVNVEKG